ncbi:MAG: DUF5329 family protein [Bacteroidetes bacterium]|nr:DUF5329 family protein [Bacteroidota bacterium]
MFLWIGVGQSIFLFAQTEVETKKIEFLLREVQQLNGAKFWRNGSSYSPKQAADHLRMKWHKAGSSIKTAKDFIEKIASKSSISGKAYEIEFENGTKVETHSFLYKKLGDGRSNNIL